MVSVIVGSRQAPSRFLPGNGAMRNKLLLIARLAGELAINLLV
jgi:hypothetical protein